MRIAIVACAKKKQPGCHPARELYSSQLFQSAFAYAKEHYDGVFILSAKYGLITGDKKIHDYDQTLKAMSMDEKKDWSELVLKQIYAITRPGDEIYFFCGKHYRRLLLAQIKDRACHVPLQGYGIGKQLQFYKNARENNA